MVEEWKDVIEFEGRYQVSNFGNIRSCDRYARVCGNGQRFVKGKELKPGICTNGYLAYLFTNGKAQKKMYLLHRLVAIHFIPNPDNLPEVNHKDEDITNNCVSNLEWCTSKYNANYGSRNERMLQTKESKGQFVPVEQYTKDEIFIKKWERISEASIATGADISSILRVCNGKQRTSVGYIWRYVNGYEKSKEMPTVTDEYKIEHFGYSTCPTCGKTFIKQNFSMTFCCYKCRREAYKAIKHQS